MALTTMTFKGKFRKASIALVAGACLLLVEAPALVQAQTQMITSPDGSGAPNVAIAERIVLHGVCFQARSDKIDKRSLPVLDYGAQVLKRSPEPLVYVEVPLARDRRENHVDGSSMLTDRRERALMGYLERRGVSAGRLVLLGADNSTRALNQDAADARSLDQKVEVVQLVYVARTFWTG
jgi:hypothetical protein